MRIFVTFEVDWQLSGMLPRGFEFKIQGESFQMFWDYPVLPTVKDVISCDIFKGNIPITYDYFSTLLCTLNSVSWNFDQSTGRIVPNLTFYLMKGFSTPDLSNPPA